jgi:hypothetical protein
MMAKVADTSNVRGLKWVHFWPEKAATRDRRKLNLNSLISSSKIDLNLKPSGVERDRLEPNPV